GARGGQPLELELDLGATARGLCEGVSAAGVAVVGALLVLGPQPVLDDPPAVVDLDHLELGPVLTTRRVLPGPRLGADPTGRPGELPVDEKVVEERLVVG